MSGGTAAALGIGAVVVIGGVVYFVTRAPAPQQAGTLPADYPYGYPYTALSAPTPPGAPPAAPSAASQLMSGINGLNQAGCQAAAQKVGAGQLAAIGCSEFLKYATPLGIAQFANTEIQKIPYVGGAIGKAESAVTSVASKPISAVKGAVSKALSFVGL